MADVAMAFLKDQGVPGLTVAIADCGQVVYEAGFGFADKARAEKVVPTNLFRIASVSKVLTSVAVFTLIEKSHLTLADKVFGADGVLGTDYGTPPYKLFVKDITIEHLLTHTSGWQKDVPDPMFSHPGMNQAQLISWTIDNTPPTTPPGETFFLSNFGYCVLGRVIEKVTRQKYDDYVRATVLEPCGITDMRIAGNTRAERAQGEVVYYAEGGADPYRQDVARTDSVGGWIATAGDLVRFATHIETVLKPATIVTMTTLEHEPAPPLCHGLEPVCQGLAYFGRWKLVVQRHDHWHFSDLGTIEVLPILGCARELAQERAASVRRRPGARRNDAGHGPRGESLEGLKVARNFRSACPRLAFCDIGSCPNRVRKCA